MYTIVEVKYSNFNFRFDLASLLYHVRPWHQLFYTFGLIFVVRHIEQYSLQICVDVQIVEFCSFY